MYIKRLVRNSLKTYDGFKGQITNISTYHYIIMASLVISDVYLLTCEQWTRRLTCDNCVDYAGKKPALHRRTRSHQNAGWPVPALEEGHGPRRRQHVQSALAQTQTDQNEKCLRQRTSQRGTQRYGATLQPRAGPKCVVEERNEVGEEVEPNSRRCSGQRKPKLEDWNSSLTLISLHVSLPFFSHSCNMVRASTALHMHQLADSMEQEQIFTAPKAFRDRFITAICKASLDAAPEVRWATSVWPVLCTAMFLSPVERLFDCSFFCCLTNYFTESTGRRFSADLPLIRDSGLFWPTFQKRTESIWKR